MKSRSTLVLSITAGALLVATVMLYVINPDESGAAQSREAREELDALTAKAATYYEFGHYVRAADTYREAADLGMADPLEWYRYAHSVDLARGADLALYLRAYGTLLESAPNHEYRAATEQVLLENSVELDYGRARDCEYDAGTLVRFTGTVTDVVPGRVEAHTDRIYAATRPDPWLGHIGDEVVVEMPRHERPRRGTTLTVIGTYVGWREYADGSRIARLYPVVEGIGASVVKLP